MDNQVTDLRIKTAPIDPAAAPTPTPEATHKQEKMYGSDVDVSCCECCEQDDMTKYLRKLLLYLQIGGNSIWIIFLIISIAMLFRKANKGGA